MPENKNIRYPKMDKYVGLFSLTNTASCLMLRADYDAVANVLAAASPETRKIIDSIAHYQLLQHKKGLTLQDPWEQLSPQQQQKVTHELTGYSPMNYDLLTVRRDIQNNREGYHTPVYNVNGHPVRVERFDENGNLDANVAKIYGVAPPTQSGMKPR